MDGSSSMVATPSSAVVPSSFHPPAWNCVTAPAIGSPAAVVRLTLTGMVANATTGSSATFCLRLLRMPSWVTRKVRFELSSSTVTMPSLSVVPISFQPAAWYSAGASAMGSPVEVESVTVTGTVAKVMTGLSATFCLRLLRMSSWVTRKVRFEGRISPVAVPSSPVTPRGFQPAAWYSASAPAMGSPVEVVRLTVTGMVAKVTTGLSATFCLRLLRMSSWVTRKVRFEASISVVAVPSSPVTPIACQPRAWYSAMAPASGSPDDVVSATVTGVVAKVTVGLSPRCCFWECSTPR